MASTPKRLRPRRTPTQERSRRTRDRILEAAARVVVEHGYAAGTTNRIAEAAGLSVGSLYQYYPNKDAILLELVAAHLEDGARTVTGLLADPERLPATLEGRVRTFVRAAIDVHRADPELHRVLFEESPRAAAVLDQFHELEMRLVEAAEALLADMLTVSPAARRRSAWLAVTTIESVVHRSLSSRMDGITPTALEDDLVAMIVGYLEGGT